MSVMGFGFDVLGESWDLIEMWGNHIGLSLCLQWA